jgi:hypothetical protein
MTRGVGGHSPANIAHSLKGIDFPAKKQDLVEHARKNNAEDAVMEILRQMPEQEYHTMADVMKGVGQVE